MWCANSPLGTLVSFRAGLVEQTMRQLSLEPTTRWKNSTTAAVYPWLVLSLKFSCLSFMSARLIGMHHCVCVWVPIKNKRRVSHTLELDLQVALSCWICTMGNKLVSPARSTSILCFLVFCLFV